MGVASEKRQLQLEARAEVVRPVLRSLDLRCRASVVDLGCGAGSWALELASQGHRVVAVDKRTEALDWVRQEARRLSLRVDCVRADLRYLRPRRRFDLVLHVFTGVTTTEHLHRLVSANGVVLWRETYDGDDTQFEWFDSVWTSPRRRGLRLLRERRSSATADKPVACERDAAAALVQAAVKPLARLERVVAGVPRDDLGLGRGPATQDDADVGAPREQDQEVAVGRAARHVGGW